MFTIIGKSQNFPKLLIVEHLLFMNVQNALQDRQVYKEKFMELKLKFDTQNAFIN